MNSKRFQWKDISLMVLLGAMICVCFSGCGFLDGAVGGSEANAAMVTEVKMVSAWELAKPFATITAQPSIPFKPLPLPNLDPVNNEAQESSDTAQPEDNSYVGVDNPFRLAGLSREVKQTKQIQDYKFTTVALRRSGGLFGLGLFSRSSSACGPEGCDVNSAPQQQQAPAQTKTTLSGPDLADNKSTAPKEPQKEQTVVESTRVFTRQVFRSGGFFRGRLFSGRVRGALSALACFSCRG